MRLEPARRPVSPQASDWSPEPGAGQRVEVLWDSPHGWYPGTVLTEATEQSGLGLVRRIVQYDDGTMSFEQLGGRRTRPEQRSRTTESGGAPTMENTTPAVRASKASRSPASRPQKAAASGRCRRGAEDGVEENMMDAQLHAPNRDVIARERGTGRRGDACTGIIDFSAAGEGYGGGSSGASAGGSQLGQIPANELGLEPAVAEGSLRRVLLPLGVTQAQRQKIEENPGGVLGRFGLSGLPENTWQCFGSEFVVR